MRILAIETSCDETSVSVLEIKGCELEIKSNIISSQIKIHQKWGGVVPMLAKREHQRNLVPVLKKALLKAGLLKPKIKNHRIGLSKRLLVGLQSKTQIKNKKLKEILKREEFLYQKLERFLINYQKPKINFIAVTVGLGLEPALWVGVNFARALSYFWNLPLMPVNHIEAHLLVNFIDYPVSKIQYPAIGLTVSGGHTILVLMYKLGKYKIIGETRDDSAGECFDKVARTLGLGYPGGPAIAEWARRRKPEIRNQKFEIKLPRPMMYTKDYDFSFSGLKTAVLYNFKNQKPNVRKSKAYIRRMCFEVQQAIIDVLIHKTILAAKEYNANTIMLGGGVAANEELRKQLRDRIQKEMPNTKYLMPDTKLCTDNAVMIGVAAYFHWLWGERKNWKEIKADANLTI